MYYLTKDNKKYQGLARLLDSAKIDYSFDEVDGVKVVDNCGYDNEISYSSLVKKLSKEVKQIAVCGHSDKTMIVGMLVQTFSHFKNVSYLMDNEGLLKDDSDFFCFEMHDEDLLAYSPEYCIINDASKQESLYINFLRNVKEAILCNVNDVDAIFLNDIDVPIFTYGLDENADFSACNLEIDEDYARFDLNFKSNYIASYTLPFTDSKVLICALSVIALATLYCFDARTLEVAIANYR